ncbi:MAG: alkaline phosphatase family protein, partial [Gemmatimonadota bacterium]
EIETRPIMDSLTLDFAFTGVRTLGLGQRAGADFLSVSLSTTDAIGHRWGPGSRELHDQLLRLDRYLGAFLDSLATIVPPNQMIVTLTADHGVTEYPEAGVGGRISFSTQVRAMTAYGRDRWRLDLGAGQEAGLLFGDREALARRGVDVDSLSDALAAEVMKVAGVRRVLTPRTLAAAKPGDLDAMRWRRELPAGFSWFVAALAKPGYVFGTNLTSTSHGTLNLDDVRVPLLFRVPGVPARRVERVVRTLDLAPTLAALLGLRPTEPVEGVPLPELFGRRPTR